MIYKMKSITGFKGSAFEPTYQENVDVRNGIAICRTREARDALFVRGYDLLEEIPLDLSRNEGIPGELYTEQPYQKPIEADTLSESNPRKRRGRPPRNKGAKNGRNNKAVQPNRSNQPFNTR